VIGTSTENDPINTASKYYTHYASGHYWVMFDHGGIPGCILYSSPDGVTWTSQGAIFAGNNPVSFTNEGGALPGKHGDRRLHTPRTAPTGAGRPTATAP
jgi:hypothetical protein